VAHVDVRRRERMTGNVIAAEVVVSSVTVSRILKQLGLNSSKTLGPGEPIRRCDREHSGELTHIDVTKLGKFNRVGHRITGDPTGQSMKPGISWEFVHVCVDATPGIVLILVPVTSRQSVDSNCLGTIY
jgi:hypothetical protein